MVPNKRLNTETYEEFKIRLKQRSILEKVQKQGTMFWDSSIKKSYTKSKYD